MLALWLKELEFRNVKVPLSGSQMPRGAQKSSQWGQKSIDIEIYFHQHRVTDVRLEIQAFREDYMIATASSDARVSLSPFQELNLELDVCPQR